MSHFCILEYMYVVHGSGRLQMENNVAAKRSLVLSDYVKMAGLLATTQVQLVRSVVSKHSAYATRYGHVSFTILVYQSAQTFTISNKVLIQTCMGVKNAFVSNNVTYQISYLSVENIHRQRGSYKRNKYVKNQYAYLTALLRPRVLK